MKKLTVLAAIFGLISVAVACNDGGESAAETQPAAETPTSSEIVINEPSELATLMRSMFDQNMEIRTAILNGEVPESFPEEYYNLHTAHATEPEKITETYHAMADNYLESMNTVVSSSGEEAVGAFNNMVTACIGCHQAVSCQGPIPKIKQLRIKADEA